MKIKIPEIDVKGMNCKLAIASSILVGHGIDFYGVLCNSLCFSYSPEDEMRADNLFYGDVRGESRYLGDLYGLILREGKEEIGEEFTSLVKKRLEERKTTIIVGKIWNCPYNDRKFPVNYIHFSAINGLDEEERNYLVSDAFLKKYDIPVNIDVLHKYIEKYLVYELKDEVRKVDYMNKKELRTYSFQNLLLQSQTDQFDKSTDYLADRLESASVFKNVIMGEEEQFYRLSNAFSEMKECNELYLDFLRYVIEEKDELHEMETVLEKIIAEWEKVIGWLLKCYVIKDAASEIRFQISDHVREIANHQRTLLDLFLN